MTPPVRWLRVEAPHFVAAAEWEKGPAGWRCTQAAPILRWMVGRPAPAVADDLRRRGWAWGWL